MTRHALLFLASLSLAACDGVLGNTTIPASTALTDGVSFSGGSVRPGAPPDPTNNPGDPVVSGAPTDASTMSPGGQGSMDIAFSSVASGSPFDVNVQFDDEDRHIRIPISTSVTGGATAGTLRIPFTISDNVCSNLDEINHQIRCYESVSIGGQRVSRAQARQLVLACQNGGGDGGFGEGSYCAYNYPEVSCDLVRDNLPPGLGVTATFTPGTGSGACSQAGVPTEWWQDFGFAGGEGLGRIGACIVRFPVQGRQRTDGSLLSAVEFDTTAIEFIPLADDIITD